MPAMLGTVRELNEGCGEPGELVNSTCRSVEVACPAVPPIRARLRVKSPPGWIENRGTIVFGTGGAGIGFVEDNPLGLRLLRNLVDEGYTVVQRSWATPWEEGPEGMRAVSCRYATLLHWIHEQIATRVTQGEEDREGAFCAMGNSGGGAEIAYALAFWGGAEILDAAVVSGGPPMARLDWGCLEQGDAAWQQQCQALVAGRSACTPAVLECTFHDDPAGNNPQIIDLAYPQDHCSQASEAQRQAFLHDSILAPDARLDYPNTTLRFLYGEQDCTSAVPLGLTYAEAVQSDQESGFIPGVGHDIYASQAGALAVFEALTESCVP